MTEIIPKPERGWPIKPDSVELPIQARSVDDELSPVDDGLKVQKEDLTIEVNLENEENDVKKPFDFNEDVGNFYCQILMKGEKIPISVRVQFSLFVIMVIVLQTMLYMSLNNYLGISYYGVISRNSADGAKEMAPKCLKEYIKEYQNCVGTKQLFDGENEYKETQAFKDYYTKSKANEEKCNKKDKMQELCMMEVRQTYGGSTGMLRWVLMILCVFIAKKDFDSLNQSVFLYKQMDNSPGIFHTALFTVYCIFRVFCIFWGLLITFELTTNAVYFRTAMDICMNFAALVFLLKIDDLLFSQNWFPVLKTKYDLFGDDEYPMEELEEMGSFRQVCVPKRMRGSWKCCRFWYLTWFAVEASLFLSIPYRIMGEYDDMHQQGGEYWMAKFGAWFNEDWYVTAQQEPEYAAWNTCKENGGGAWACMESQTKVNQWLQTGQYN